MLQASATWKDDEPSLRSIIHSEQRRLTHPRGDFAHRRASWAVIGTVPSVTVVEDLVRAGFPLILDDEHLLDPGLTTRNRLGIEARDLDPLGKEIELVVPW